MADYDALLKRLDERHRTEWLNHEAAAAIRDLERQVAEAKAELANRPEWHNAAVNDALGQRDALAAQLESVRSVRNHLGRLGFMRVEESTQAIKRRLDDILDAAPAAVLNDRLAQAFGAGVDATNEAWENVVRAPRVKEAGE